MRTVSHPRLRDAVKMIGMRKPAFQLVKVAQLILWELMKTQTRVKNLEEKMDKQIKKVQKDVVKGNKPKAKKDIKKLLKMDKKFDAKLEKCDMPMKPKSKKK